jgi:hypothetical protein
MLWMRELMNQGFLLLMSTPFNRQQTIYISDPLHSKKWRVNSTRSAVGLVCRSACRFYTPTCRFNNENMRVESTRMRVGSTRLRVDVLFNFLLVFGIQHCYY